MRTFGFAVCLAVVTVAGAAEAGPRGGHRGGGHGLAAPVAPAAMAAAPAPARVHEGGTGRMEWRYPPFFAMPVMGERAEGSHTTVVNVHEPVPAAAMMLPAMAAAAAVFMAAREPRLLRRAAAAPRHGRQGVGPRVIDVRAAVEKAEAGRISGPGRLIRISRR